MSDERKPLMSIRANPQWLQRQNSGLHTSNTRQLSDSSQGQFHAHSNGSAAQSYTMPHSVRITCVIILLTVILERVCNYGLVGNLVLFLNEKPFTWKSYHAIGASYLLSGITFVMAFIGGWIADSCLGRFKTIVMAFIIYTVGFSFMPVLAYNSREKKHNASDYIHVDLPGICDAQYKFVTDGPFDENCAWLIFLTLCVVAVGSGALKSNICPFGAEQLMRLPQSSHLSFFNWFYWCINFGCFIGYGLVAYIEQEINFFIGYLMCIVALGSSALLFLSGRMWYVTRPPDGSVLTNIIRIIHEAWRRKKQYQEENDIHEDNESRSSNSTCISSANDKLSFLDHAKHRNGGLYPDALVDDIKKLKMIFIVFVALIPYWLVYFQMQTTFLVQGLHMRLTTKYMNYSRINSSVIIDEHYHDPKYVANNPEIVAAWFTLFDAVFVIIFLPLFDRVVYPRMARAGYPFSFTKRIALGMFLSILAIIVAGVVEHFRLEAFWPDPDHPCVNNSFNQIIGDTTYHAADMSVFWQIPQYALIGISEVFASVACLQFSVSVAPKSMTAIVTGLYYTFSGLGSLFGIAIINILAQYQLWFHTKDFGDINCRLPCAKDDMVVTQECHLDYYFYLLAGLEGVALVLFLIVSHISGLNKADYLLSLTPPRHGIDNIQRSARRNRFLHQQPMSQ